MKTLIFTTMLLISNIASAQNKTNNTLDINYMATYKSSFSLRMSTKLFESQNWALNGFNGGAVYNVSRKLTLTYDFWRNNNPNSPIIQKYGLAFTTQNKYTNFSLSMYQTYAPNTPNNFAGRIDLNMTLK